MYHKVSFFMKHKRYSIFIYVLILIMLTVMISWQMSISSIGGRGFEPTPARQSSPKKPSAIATEWVTMFANHS